MANNNEKKTPTQQQYDKLNQKHELKRPVLKNCLRAFFVGGVICTIGQAITYFLFTFLTLLNKQLAIQQ